jgi:hypothetical protein
VSLAKLISLTVECPYCRRVNVTLMRSGQPSHGESVMVQIFKDTCENCGHEIEGEYVAQLQFSLLKGCKRLTNMEG